MAELSRREVVQGAIAVGVGLMTPALQTARAAAANAPARVAVGNATQSTWLDTKPIADAAVGVTWGVPWARGQVKKDQPLRVEAEGGNAVPAQTWTTAFWPDGSVKWSAIALAPAATTAAAFSVSPGGPTTETASTVGVRVEQAADSIRVDTGVIQCVVPKTGNALIRSVTRGDKTILKNGRLMARKQNTPDADAPSQRQSFYGAIESAVVEQDGPTRTVVKITGTHSDDASPFEAVDRKGPEHKWLPFVVRLYFYAGSDVIRVMHSFVFDGDESKDFLCGLGVRFDVPMTDELHNRHVRLVGQDDGLFYEAVRSITGMRRDPGAAARQAQADGKATSSNDWATTVSNNLQRIPAWGDFTLTQLSADGYNLRKRTKAGCGWIPCGAGQRAAGSGFVGGATGGGVSFGMRDFWQKHPAQLDIRNAASETAEVTCWLVSPEAPPMDLRMYHDVMGMDTYDKQNEGLAITYEDYEPGYGTPYGIARTSEMSFKIEAATPTRAASAAFARVVAEPPMLMASPERFLQSGVFGKQWSLPDKSNPTKAWVEDRLAMMLDQYITEIEQRRWYGFWDFGDVMHSYDTDRHQWKYDVGGFAWDNSELSTDLWLWLSVLRTGRADVYRMAEAMCRHTGEVDVYHLGRFKGLGTRHGVQHWSDSSKQSRISTPIYRRIFYYLTADERVGDLLTEQMHTIEAEKKIVIGRKLKPGSPNLPLPAVEDGPPGGDVDLGGLNYGNALAAWVTQAERTGDPAWHKKIVEAMRGVGDLKRGFFETGWTTNIDTGHVTPKPNADIGLSHLQACFGLPELSIELIDLYGQDAPKYADAWAQYGRLYSGTDAERQKELAPFKAGLFKEASLRDSHSRIVAFAAVHDKSDARAKQAWADLLGNRFTPGASQPTPKKLKGPDVLNPTDEVPMGTNGSAQWGLAAIHCLALIGDKL